MLRVAQYRRLCRIHYHQRSQQVSHFPGKRRFVRVACARRRNSFSCRVLPQTAVPIPTASASAPARWICSFRRASAKIVMIAGVFTHRRILRHRQQPALPQCSAPATAVASRSEKQFRVNCCSNSLICVVPVFFCITYGFPGQKHLSRQAVVFNASSANGPLPCSTRIR